MPYGAFGVPPEGEMVPREEVAEEAVVLLMKMMALVRPRSLGDPYWTTRKMALDRDVHPYELGNYTLVASGDVHLMHVVVAS